MPKANQTAKQQQSKVNEAVARLVRLARSYLGNAREAHRAYLHSLKRGYVHDSEVHFARCMERRTQAFCYMKAARILKAPHDACTVRVPLFHRE